MPANEVMKANDTTSTNKHYQNLKGRASHTAKPISRGVPVDLKLMDDLESKAKQILVDIHSDELSGHREAHKSLMSPIRITKPIRFMY
jgi:hypothetical protein